MFFLLWPPFVYFVLQKVKRQGAQGDGMIRTEVMLTVATNPVKIHKRSHEIDSHDHNDNVWYCLENVTAQVWNISDCYVCSFIPHHAQCNPVYTPEHTSMIETIVDCLHS